MLDDIETKNYELAYHITPDIEEGEIKAKLDQLQSLITQAGGQVNNSHEPKRKHLSYPLHQKHYSYFGSLDFTASPEFIEKFNSEMKLQNHFLRYLVINKMDSSKGLRVLGTERPKPRMKTHEPTTPNREDIQKAGKPKEVVTPGQIEKEIEDVLEKI